MQREPSTLVGIDFQEKMPVFVYRLEDTEEPGLHYSMWRLTPPSQWLGQAARQLENLLDVEQEAPPITPRPTGDDDEEDDDDSVTLGEAIHVVHGMKSVNLHERQPSDEAGSEEPSMRGPPSRRPKKKKRDALLTLTWVQMAQHMPRIDDDVCLTLAESDLTLEELQRQCELTEDQCRMLKHMDNVNADVDPREVFAVLDPGAALVYAYSRKRTSLLYALIQRCIKKKLDPIAWHWYAASHSLDVDLYRTCEVWASSILYCTLMLQRTDHYLYLRKTLSTYARVSTDQLSYALLASGDADLARGVPTSTTETSSMVQLMCGAIRGHHGSIFKTILSDALSTLNVSHMSRIAAEMRYTSSMGMLRDASLDVTHPLATFTREGFYERSHVPLRLWDWTSVVKVLIQCESHLSVDVWHRLLAVAQSHVSQWPPGHILQRKISQRTLQSDRSSDLKRSASDRALPSSSSHHFIPTLKTRGRRGSLTLSAETKKKKASRNDSYSS